MLDARDARGLAGDGVRAAAAAPRRTSRARSGARPAWPWRWWRAPRPWARARRRARLARCWETERRLKLGANAARRADAPGGGPVRFLTAGAGRCPCPRGRRRTGRGAALAAGAAVEPLELPPGTPLAGYGGFPRRAWFPAWPRRGPRPFWFRPSTGRPGRAPRARPRPGRGGDPRAVARPRRGGSRSPRSAPSSRERLARGGHRPPAAIIVSAVTPHSGPGGYADSELFGVIAVDRPSPRRSRPAPRRHGARVRERADASRTPALLGAGSRARGRPELEPYRGGRRRGADRGQAGHAGRPARSRCSGTSPSTAPRWAGATSLLSADVMGDASARIEAALDAPALFVNGAVARREPGPARRGRHGGHRRRAVRRRARGPGGGSRSASARGLDDRAPAMALPPPRSRSGAASGRGSRAGWRSGSTRALPSATELIAVAVGSRVGAVTVPGELQMALGLEIKAAARAQLRLGGRGRAVQRLHRLSPGAGAHDVGGYMACASFYGAGRATS